MVLTTVHEPVYQLGSSKSWGGLYAKELVELGSRVVIYRNMFKHNHIVDRVVCVLWGFEKRLEKESLEWY